MDTDNKFTSKIFAFMQGQRVLVTGGVNGIGKVIVREFAKARAKVVIADLDVEAGKRFSLQLNDLGGDTRFVEANLQNPYDLENIVVKTVNYFGGLDAVVNNARPFLSPIPFPENMVEWDLSLDVMLKAPAFIIGHALPFLEKSEFGSVVNMSSTNAFTVSQQSVSYHVAKAGLIHLTRCLADELGPKGVRVNALCPGLVDQEDMELALTNDPRNQKIVETIVPLQRACSPIEIAAMVAFLCSPASAYINGQAITMDGGMSAVDQFRVATDILDVHS